MVLNHSDNTAWIAFLSNVSPMAALVLKNPSSPSSSFPVVLLAAFSRLAAGAAACLKKPLDVLEVRRQVIDAFNLREMAGGDDRRGATPKDESAKVLLVTQNADFRSKVKDELSAAKPPVEILTAQTGADALLVAQAAPPQFVLLSMNVPDIEKSKVIEKLVAAAGGQGIHIIAVHDAPTDDLRSIARTAGARMCLPTSAVTGSVRELLGV